MATTTSDIYNEDSESLGVPEFPTDESALESDETAEEDLDEDIDDETDETEGESTSASTAARRARTETGARRPGVRRAEVRRDIAKYLQLAAVDTGDLELLGTLYGVRADAVELTVAVMAGSRASLSAVSDLRDIAEADPFEAPLVAASLGTQQLKAVHSLLVTLDAASTKDLPGGAVTKAAGRVARDVHGLDAQARERLDRVLGLTKRTV